MRQTYTSTRSDKTKCVNARPSISRRKEEGTLFRYNSKKLATKLGGITTSTAVMIVIIMRESKNNSVENENNDQVDFYICEDGRKKQTYCWCKVVADKVDLWKRQWLR